MGDVQEYGGLEFYNGDNFAALFLSWIMQNGGDFWNEDQTKFVLTSPEAKEAWQKFSRSRYGGKSNRYETHYCKNAEQSSILANKAAQLVKGPGHLQLEMIWKMKIGNMYLCLL